MSGPLDHIPATEVRMALEKLADAGPEALRLFDEGAFDAAALEVERAAEAVNTVRRVRRQARASTPAGGSDADA